MKKNNISIVLVSKGKNPSRHFDININLIRFTAALFIGFICFSVAYIYSDFLPGKFTLKNNQQVHIIPELGKGVRAEISEPEKSGEYGEVLELDFPLFELDNGRIENATNGNQVDDKITNRLLEVERKLIDMQELLKKKGIKKKLSVGGEYIPADRLSDEYLDAINKDIDNLSKVFRVYPIGKPARGLISSGYGYRKDPFHKRKAFHSGLDISSRYGVSVKSTAEGVVEKAGWYKGYGKCVIIRHESGYKTLYGHLSKITVKRGQKIASGEVIGRVGSTGRSTGPHLHYEIIKNGKRINPKKYLTMG